MRAALARLARGESSRATIAAAMREMIAGALRSRPDRRRCSWRWLASGESRRRDRRRRDRDARGGMVPVPAARADLLDTCGTGGSGMPRRNVSTAVALAVAACGVRWPSTATGRRRAAAAAPTCSSGSGVAISTPRPRRSPRAIDARRGRLLLRARAAPRDEARRWGAAGARGPHDLQPAGAAGNPARATRQLLGVLRSGAMSRARGRGAGRAWAAAGAGRARVRGGGRAAAEAPAGIDDLQPRGRDAGGQWRRGAAPTRVCGPRTPAGSECRSPRWPGDPLRERRGAAALLEGSPGPIARRCSIRGRARAARRGRGRARCPAGLARGGSARCSTTGGPGPLWRIWWRPAMIGPRRSMSDAEPTYLDRILAAKRAELAGQGRRGRGADRGAARGAELAAAAAGAGPGRPRCAGAASARSSPSSSAPRRRAVGSARTRTSSRIVRGYAGGRRGRGVACCRPPLRGQPRRRAGRPRACLRMPVLCKDFILDRRQVLAARRAGADAILLIVAALPAPALRPLVTFAHSSAWRCCARPTTTHEVDRAMAAGARLVGGNARDLRTFEVDLARAARLRSLVPARSPTWRRAGSTSPADLRLLRDAGVDAVLVGGTLMAAARSRRGTAGVARRNRAVSVRLKICGIARPEDLAGLRRPRRRCDRRQLVARIAARARPGPSPRAAGDAAASGTPAGAGRRARRPRARHS